MALKAQTDTIKILNYATGRDWMILHDLGDNKILVDDGQLNSFIIEPLANAMLYVDFEGDPELFEQIASLFGACTYYSMVAFDFRHLKW